MKHRILAAAFAVTLSGCGGSTGGLTPVVQQVQQDLATFIADAQSAARGICSVVPTVASLVQLFNVGDPLISTGTAAAKLICSEVTAAPAAVSAHRQFRGTLIRIPAPVVVDGVVIHFH